MRNYSPQVLAGLAFFAMTAASAAPLLGPPTEVRVRVTVENVSPIQATNTTPVWIAFHDGTFDVYDDASPASAAFESLAEDGDAALLSTDFTTAAVGQIDGVIGSAPLTPGTSASSTFLVDPSLTTARFFSYAAMMLPSNDAFVGNEDPLAIPIFDMTTAFVAEGFFVTGADVRDAGTEVNDEDPANIPTLAQAAPNTGTTEGGNIGIHAGFNAVGAGGILDNPSYSQGDFTAAGYPVFKFRFAAADAILEDLFFNVSMKGVNEIPEVSGKAKGSGSFDLIEEGTLIEFKLKFSKLKNVTAAHLHLGAVDEEGPVVVDLLDGETPKSGNFKKLKGEITMEDLVGPMAAMPLDALVAEMGNGNVYVNIHTTKNPDGEIRGQVNEIIITATK